MKIKRILALALLFVLCLGMSVYADVAYTPIDDFYEENYRECQGIERYHIANGEPGCVVGYSPPTGEAKVVIPNGKEYFVSVVWSEESDIVWGCIEYDPETLDIGWAHRGGECAWVDMSQMTPRYDSRAFMEDHAAELLDETRTVVLKPDEEMLTYLYPGSGIVTDPILNWDSEDMTVELGNIYTDSEGREWGRIGYLYGIRDVWVCIDEPYTQLPAGSEFVEREIIPAAGTETLEDSLRDARGIESYSTVIVIAVVIMAAAMCAYIIIRRRRG